MKATHGESASSGSATAPVRVHAAIVGSGQAGPALASALSQDGETVVMFEGDRLGGTCVNTGCTPTKTLRKSARIAHLARRASEFGVHVGSVTVDFAEAMERMARTVDDSRNGLARWMHSAKHLEVVRAWARFIGRDGDGFVLEADGRQFVAERVYLNVGTQPVLPPVPGLETVDALLNDTLLELRERPSHLVVLGGSYIGLELGQIFRRLGSDVTVVEAAPTLIAREDADVTSRIAEMLQAEGIKLVTGAQVKRATGQSGREVRLEGTLTGGADFAVGGSHLLVATGRKPNTESLGLDRVGVAVDKQGYIPVNGALATNVPGIWALGDVNKRGAFTHTSYQDHQIVLANHRGGDRSADGRVMTYALYTDPPLGRVGMSEADARREMMNGRRFLQAVHPMQHVSRAKEESETVGVMKLLVDADSGLLVGASLLGIGSDEIVQVINVMIAANAPYTVLRDFLPIHPTVTEFFPTILGKLAPLV